jgi:glycosyltransferase involved in cell wall biosynthesis
MKKTAVLIPCYNEEQTIAGVVRDFKSRLPEAEIYVYDNNSTDKTADEARRAGAIVRYEKKQGKGNVIRTMFREVDADLYLMVDGDGTYPADMAHELMKPVIEGIADMAIGSRLHDVSESKFRPINRLGNKIFLFVLNSVFNVNVTDLLSGYRAMNRHVVKSLPIISSGFEIETELTVKSLERRLRIIEVPINLSQRPEGSFSKIRLFKDGIIIFNTIIALFRDYKPFLAFGAVGLLLFLCSLIPGVWVLREFLYTGYIHRIPSAILAVGLALSGLLVAFVGLILHTISRRFQEVDCQLQNLFTQIEQAGTLRKNLPD